MKQITFKPAAVHMSSDRSNRVTITLTYGDGIEAWRAYQAAMPRFRRFKRADGIALIVKPTVED